MGKAASLANMSVSELQREIARRRRSVSSLLRKRERLANKLKELDALIAETGGNAGGVRVRPENSVTLLQAMQKSLKGKTMSVTELAEQVKKDGYQTFAANFRVMVNQTLIKYPRVFKRVDRGQYTLA
jgi:chromosome segregation ATPase